ncbi:MAG: hypothetical protein ACKVQK_30920 [Burkholderiales bacterium]
MKISRRTSVTNKPASTLAPVKAAAKFPGDARVEEHIEIGSLVFKVEPIAVGSARSVMPALIRASSETGRAFLIRNAKNASAATALLINPLALNRRLLAAKPRRTLGNVIDTLPFKRRGAPRLIANLPDDNAPQLRIPGQDMAKIVPIEAAGIAVKDGQYGPETEAAA